MGVITMLHTIIVIFFISSLVSIQASPINQKQPKFVFTEVSGGGTYKVGQSALLKVKTSDDDHLDENDDWKFCTWTRLRDGASCTFIYECDGPLCDIGVGDFYITSSCTGDLGNRVSFSGEDPNQHNRVCGVRIPNITTGDSSTWSVSVEECRVTGCGSNDGNDAI